MVQRTVRFFEVLDAHGNQFPDLDWDELLTGVRRMPNTQAYVRVARMELLGSAFHPGRGGKRACPMLILDRITREARMRIENQRRYRPLELQEGDTLAEPTHYGLFSGNVVGMLRAGTHTPGPASLRDFINAAGLLDAEVTVKALADLNAMRALGSVGNLTRLEVEMDAASASQVLESQSLLGQVFDTFRTR